MIREFQYLVLLLFLSTGIFISVSASPEVLKIHEINIQGNHVTSEKYILRELAFRLNQTFSSDSAEYLRTTSINNLIKTSLFNFVEIELQESDDGLLTVTVSLTERWYIWPYAYLNHADRNFSEWWRTKDLDRLEYGAGLKVNNFRGMGETLLLNFRLGNYAKIEFDYRGIFLDKAKHNSISLLASWSAKKVLPYLIESDKELILNEDFFLLRSLNLSAKYKYRKGFFNSHNVEIGFWNNRIADTIRFLNPYYAGEGTSSQKYFNLKYEFKQDNRDSHIYPKTGHLLVAGINKKGFNILPGEYNALDIYGHYYYYKKIISRFYFATGIWLFATLSDEYVFSSQTGLGYLQFVRGYEYYPVNGDNAWLFKSLFKYELLPVKVIKLNVWPVRKLHQFNRIPLEIYSNLFFDAGYVNDGSGFYKIYNNSLVDKVMYSTGIGIDFVTYYDKVLRLDYSFNALGERGLFIHWKAAFR